MERPTESGEEGGEKYICYDCHGGDVEIGGIDVLDRGGEEGGVLGLGYLAAWRGDGGHGALLLAGPGFVAPGEEDEKEFFEDVGVGNVEVVF
jgi:hypothetical protein